MAELALVLLIGLIGPILATPRRFALPVAVGEILAGVVFGISGLRVLNPSAANLQLLSSIGFALVMMVTGSHIDVRRFTKLGRVRRAAWNVVLIASAAAVAGWFLSHLVGQTENFGIFTVILASSSAAVVLPIYAARKPEKGQKSSLQVFLIQVTLTDLLAIILVPLVSKSSNAGSVALGALFVTLAAVTVYLILRYAQHSGAWTRARTFSAEHGFGLELRLSLILLLSLIVLAQSFQVTIMIAGFGLGLAIGANGVPKRLAKQLFAVSEGFFAPIFFVLLGASIDVTALLNQPQLLVLAALLGFGAVLVHLVPVVTGVHLRMGVASSAQLGVPAAAVSIGLANHSFSGGTAAAVMLGALITLAATAIAAAAKAKA